jgi:hypothetical protein
MKWKKWDGTGRKRDFIDADKDDIYYFREYTPREGFTYSETNNLIINFKMGSKPENKNRLHYRAQAIDTFSRELQIILSTISQNVWISWIPSSKTPTDPYYDDRLEKVVLSTCKILPYLHAVEILYTIRSREPLHYGAIRNPITLARTYSWRNVNLSDYNHLILVDDVLTQGTNFRAVSDTIKKQYPHMSIHGLIWAFAV